ncbi:hypothetical protein GOD83_06830 [Sinorhizobium medicae]|nr:hypothetical protein [Sinorhizobium medicae]MDX0578219.1 hypothetical protein [Sinorhizobium medicae]MDX0780069.1 hypothetical protein [Sinorhizobium medicae]
MATLLIERLRELLDSDLQRGTICWNDLGRVNRAEYARRLGVTVRALPLETFSKYDDLGPRPVSKSDQLRSMLEEDHRAKKLATRRRGKLNKLHYGKAIGFINTGPYEGIFAHFQSLLDQSTVEEGVRELLSRDHADGKIVFTREGKISRKHYGELLGVTKSAMASYRGIFQEYEELEGGARRFRDRDLKRMRDWLEAGIEQDSLRFNLDGKISRKQFKQAFAISESDFQIRFSEIGELLLEYDQRAFERHAHINQVTREAESRANAPVERVSVSEPDWRSRSIETQPSLRRHQFYPCESKEAKLVALLNDHFALASTVPIDGGAFAKRLGAKPSNLGARCKEILREYEETARGTSVASRLSPSALKMIANFPELERHQFYEEGTTKALLVETFNLAHVADGIPRNASGGIDRSSLSLKFGFSPSAMSAHKKLIDDYEQAIGIIAHHDLRIPEIRAFIETSIHDGTLELLSGRINKSLLYSRVGLPPQAPTQAISDLIKEYDNLIAGTGYKPRHLQKEIDSLIRALESEPPLEPRKGQSYSRRRLASLTGIALHRLKSNPFITIIRRSDEKLLERLNADDLCYIIKGQKYSFHTLVDIGLSHRFAASMAKGFYDCFRAAPPHARKSAASSLKHFLGFLARSDGATCQTICRHLNNGAIQSVAAADWAECTYSYASSIAQEASFKGGTVYRKISRANVVLRHLSNKGLLPELEIPLKAKVQKRVDHRRTLAQEQSKDGVDDYLAFATARLRDGAALRSIQIDAGEEAGFLKTLREEISRGVREEHDTPAKVILHVLKRRLKLVVDAFEAVYTRWREHYRRGRELIAKGICLASTWLDDLFNVSSRSARNAEMRRVFPLDQPEQALANLLRLIWDHFKGIYPKEQNGAYGQFFVDRALEFASISDVKAYLAPPPEAVVSSLILYLADSGANIAVGRTLFTTAMEESELPNCKHITGFKARAGGKPIHSHLGVRSPAVTSMTWLLEALGPLRAKVSVEDCRLLFVANLYGGPKPISDAFVRAVFKKVLKAVPELDSLNVFPSMLRPTVLLIATLEGDANPRVGAALGQHGLNVSQGYTDHPPTRFMRDEVVRRFGNNYETLIIHGEAEAQALLGYSSEQMEAKVDELLATGLGTLCKDRTGRPGDEGSTCNRLDCWNNCPQLVVIARQDDFALLIIWRESLRAAEGEWVRDRPERWMAVWYPWLLFIEHVEQKARLLSFGRIWRQAEASATQIMQHPNFRHRSLF